MERIDTVAMENSDMLDEKHEPSTGAHLLSSSSFKGSDVAGNESVFYEKFLLDDLDNYWDELNDRLTVSRMVSDSVIKGMVHAVVDESTEKIALNEAEIATLNEKLQAYQSKSATGNMSSLFCSFSETYIRSKYIQDLDRLRHGAEQEIQKLKENIHGIRILDSHGRQNSLPADVGLCSILPHARTHEEKLVQTCESIDSLGTIVERTFREINEAFNMVKEQQWEYEFEREINAIVIRSSVKTLHDEFERNLYEQSSLINVLNMNWRQKINELSTLREDLDSLSKSLSSSEAGPLLSHGSLDNLDEWNTSKRKDHLPRMVSENHHSPHSTEAKENGITLTNQSEDCDQLMLEFADFSQLKHMSKDEFVTYFKTEMIKMRRQHDSALQEKTEELFKLKREFLREKGNSLFKKDKEFELMKKKIPQVILKLDDILLEKEKPPLVQSDHNEFCSLKNSIDTLLSENQRLRETLLENRKEIKNLSSQVSDAASQMLLLSSVETKFGKEIKKLEEDLEDVKIKACIQDELYGVILEGAISESEFVIEDIEIKTRILEDIHSTVIRGVMSDGMPMMSSIVLKYFTENSSFKALLCEKERALCAEIEEKKKLKEIIASLSEQMKEKEKDFLETGSTLMQQKLQCDMLNQQIDLLKEQLVKQEVLISNGKLESEKMMQRIEQCLHQINGSELEIIILNEKLRTASSLLAKGGDEIQKHELEIKELNEKLSTASNALEEAEKQKIMLYGIIEDRDKKLLSSIQKQKEQEKKLESIAMCLMELSKSSIDFENKLTTKVERNETRLKMLGRQWCPVIEHAKLLTKKAMLYKQMLEIRSSNLQKAEAEVDLLGDEVDALLSLLGKIYIALDHYSPVLQHYPGVMEILKLVQRELEGDMARAA